MGPGSAPDQPCTPVSAATADATGPEQATIGWDPGVPEPSRRPVASGRSTGAPLAAAARYAAWALYSEAGRARHARGVLFQAPEKTDPYDLVEAESFAARIGVDHDAVANVERLRVRLQDRCSDRKHVLPQRLAGLPGGFAADAGRP